MKTLQQIPTPNQLNLIKKAVSFKKYFHNALLLLAFLVVTGTAVFTQEWEALGQLSGDFEEVHSIHMVNENIGWLSGFKSTIAGPPQSGTWKTTDGGVTWAEMSPLPTGTPFASSLFHLYFHDEMNGWAGGENGVLYSTQDGGDSWSDIKPNDNGDNDGALGGIHSWDANLLFTSTQGGRMYKSLDAGNTWDFTLLSPDPPVNLIANDVFLKSEQEIWACGANLAENNSGFISRSIDGGQTWSYASENEDFNYRNINFIGDLGWAHSELNTTDYIQITQDGGQTWADLNLPSEGLSFFIDTERVWCLKNVSTTHKSEDGGQTWESIFIPNGPLGYYVDYSYVEDKGIWALGRGEFGGYQVYRLLFNPSATESPALVNNLVRISPNPFTDRIRIEMNESISMPTNNVSIELFDLTGKLILSESKEGMQTDKAFNIKPPAGLPSGVYSLRITTGQSFVSKKIIKY